MRYLPLVLVLIMCCCGCAKDLCPRVPRPAVPQMLPVKIENNAIKGVYIGNVVSNMLELQHLIDILEICPCYEEE